MDGIADALPARPADLFDYAAERPGTAPPPFHAAALEELLAEARGERGPRHRPDAACGGHRRTRGKTHLVRSFADRLPAAGVRGRVVLLPGFQPPLQTPHDVLRAIHDAVGRRCRPQLGGDGGEA